MVSGGRGESTVGIGCEFRNLCTKRLYEPTWGLRNDYEGTRGVEEDSLECRIILHDTYKNTKTESAELRRMRGGENSYQQKPRRNQFYHKYP